MKIFSSMFLLLILVITGNACFAQSSIIAGKITDEKNNPVTGAIVKVSKGGVAFEVRSDGDGLFYTRLLTPDNYHIDIRANGKTLKTKVHLTSQDKTRKYYYFKLMGDKVYVTVDRRDPFMKAKLSKLETANRNYMDFGGRAGTNFSIEPIGSYKLEDPSGVTTRSHFLLKVKDTANRKSVPLSDTIEHAPGVYDKVPVHKR